MIYIDYEHNPPPQELIDEGAELTRQLRALPDEDSRKKFIEEHKDYWGKLKAHLLSLSHGKCWYTEARELASAYHVDHFRPKNETKPLKKDAPCQTDCSGPPYWWLAFSWQNYRLSGSIPNTSKGSYFPLRKGSAVAGRPEELEKEWVGLLDPTVEDDVVWITFGEDGKVYPASADDASWEAKRVLLSVRVYDLNAPQLVDARIEVQNKCKGIIMRILALLGDEENRYNLLVKQEIKSRIQELKELMSPSAELSAVAKCYILNRPEAFIKRIAAAC